jgi:hypothetical protein
MNDSHQSPKLSLFNSWRIFGLLFDPGHRYFGQLDLLARVYFFGESV